jgi:NADPH:quinone reductase-like Zn-dependent oxidoreductase
MRAIEFEAYGGPDVLHLREIAPPTPANGDVLVDVHAVSVNPVDWKIRSGRMAAAMPLTFPATTGRDGAGVVRAAGPGADAGLVGKRVAFFGPRGKGTWADQLALPEANVAVIPDKVSFTDAAAVPLAGASAWIPLVDVAQVGKDTRVLIHAAAGGVGSLAVQIARARGAHVIATCSSRNVDFVRSLGAQEVIAYDRTAFEQGLRDVDVVFDTMGGDVHDRSYQVLKRGGLIVHLSAEPFVDRSAEYGVSVKPAPIVPRRDILDAMLAMMADGTLRVPIAETLPLSDYRRAQELSQTGHVRGKIVLTLR